MKTLKTLSALILAFFFISLTSAVSINDVSTNPAEVAPGEIFEISIEIENIFNYDVENLNVRLDLAEVPFAPYQSSSEEFMDKLKDGDDETFTFKLITLPDASSGIYKIPVEMEYYYNGTEQKKEIVSVTVNSNPELKISSDSSVLIRGRENILSIRVTNYGLADVKFVYLSLGDISGANLLSENEKYLGDVDSDDFDSVDYRIYIEEGSSSNLNIPIYLNYRDATNKEFSESKILTSRIYSVKEAQELGLVDKPNIILPVVIALGVLGYIVYRIIRKRRKKK